MGSGYHTCPRRGCDRRVPNRLFACLNDWWALPDPVREAIHATARMPITATERQLAIKAARGAWKVADDG